MSRSTTGRDCLEAYATVPNSFAQLCRLPAVICRTGYISSAFLIHGRSSSVRLRHGTALTARERTMAHAHFHARRKSSVASLLAGARLT